MSVNSADLSELPCQARPRPNAFLGAVLNGVPGCLLSTQVFGDFWQRFGQ